MKYPRPLKPGSTIAVTAFSTGITQQHQKRFQVVCENLKSKGFHVVVGQCLYGQEKHVSAPVQQRADELMSFLLDDNIDAVYPPWGGEVAIELLPLLDFQQLQHTRPKWMLGFSDISTLTSVITSKLGWASVHCSNLMDLSPQADDPLTAGTLMHLATETGGGFSQVASTHTYRWPDIISHPSAGLVQNHPTRWQWLVPPENGISIEGRLIGGCWDTLSYLFGTEYLDLKQLSQRYPEGIILYLENAEMRPPALVRTIISMKFRGVFDNVKGLLLGRSAAAEPDNEQHLTYCEVLQQHLTDLGIPVMFDLDIGHVPPNLTLINGAMAKVESGVIHQWL